MITSPPCTDNKTLVDLLPINWLVTFQDPVGSNFVNTRLDNERPRRHVRVEALGRVSSHNRHGPGSKPIRRKFKFEPALAFVALVVVVVQDKLSLLRPRDESAFRGRPVSMTWGQFHQHFTCSFYAHRSQMRKKESDSLTEFLCF